MEAGLADPNVNIVSLNKLGRWDVLGPLGQLRRYLSDESIDIIYSFLPMQNDLAALLKPQKSRTRLVFGARACGMQLKYYDFLSGLSYRIEPKLAFYSDAIIANSKRFIQDAATRKFPNKKIFIVPNGINTDVMRFDAAGRSKFRRHWNVPDLTPLIGVVARLDPMKDHMTFLEAAALFVSRQNNARFVCVGGGNSDNYKNLLLKRSQELGLENRVIFSGEQTEVSSVYSALDVVTLPSAFGEGFPNVIGEAMSCGRPVAATDVGDNRMIVGKFGAITPPARPDLLSLAWVELLDRYIQEQNLFQAARDHIIKNFSVETMVEATELVLKEVCARFIRL